VVNLSIAHDDISIFGALFALLQEIAGLLLLVNNNGFGTILGNIGLPSPCRVIIYRSSLKALHMVN
jgi:hypothetical protein